MSKWRTKAAVRIAEEAGLKALRTSGEAILTDAIDEAPIDTGTLRRSGTVTVGALPDGAQVYEAAESGSDMKDAFPGPEGKEKAVYISFNTPYARRMHEDLGYTPKRGGGPKYLEDPFNRLKNNALKYAERQIKKTLQKAE